MLRIDDVRLEPQPADADAPMRSTVLKFDMVNDGLLQVTDILIVVAIRDKRHSSSLDPPRVVVRPFMIKGQVTIQPGYTVHFEMLLRNLSSDCSCLADVNVISAQALPAAGL